MLKSDGVSMHVPERVDGLVDGGLKPCPMVGTEVGCSHSSRPNTGHYWIDELSKTWRPTAETKQFWCGPESARPTQGET